MAMSRRTARELALLGQSQLPKKKEKLEKKTLEDIVLAAVRTLRLEARDSLETAAEELRRGNDRLVNSEIQAAIDLSSSRTMVYESIELAEAAINRIGLAIEIPELVNLTNRVEVKMHAIEILTAVNENRAEIDDILGRSLVKWTINRLPKIDRDILRIAIAEMRYLGQDPRTAINEAVELAKRYSGEDGYRFINGVLRNAIEQMKEPVGG
ncbi:MAG: transcription antitermination protein NusB [Oscillatoria sp. SIO1A7]|nr:transcription antitermination protein NusB [Oscillatoria sp. SIO1A7]